jgi:glycerophosphoryl diester phosphodiesterase
MTHPFLNGLRPTLHIAHRGGAALAPENTLVAFRDAVERYRTDVLEIDVHATSDGAIVVAHDPTLDRTTDLSGPIASRALAEVQRADAGYRFTPDGGRTFPFRGAGVRVPLLSEVLLAFPDMRWNVEIKVDTPGVEHLVAKVIRDAGAASRVCIGSEGDAMAARIVQAMPEACVFYPVNAGTDFVMRLKSGAPDVPASPYLVLDMPLYYQGMRLVDAAFLERVSALGRWVNVWVIDEPEEMRKLVAEGVGGIMTDRPDLLRDVLDEATGRAAAPA